MIHLDVPVLPEWMSCAARADDKCRMTALERFIFDFEPPDDMEAEEWREQLQRVLKEAVLVAVCQIRPPQSVCVGRGQ